MVLYVAEHFVTDAAGWGELQSSEGAKMYIA